ncbi:MAG: hypothetical protein IPK58_09125 [Acidobacteria bacterium]|nr:hypothetical protein [Acidobacteriota bacterium]
MDRNVRSTDIAQTRSRTRNKDRSRPRRTIGVSDSRFQIPGFRFQDSRFQDSGFQIPGFQDSRIPGFQIPDSRIPDSRIPGFQIPGFQIPGFQDSRLKIFRIRKIPDSKNFGFQEFRIIRVCRKDRFSARSTRTYDSTTFRSASRGAIASSRAPHA